jgi:hypothetical protein
VNGRHSAHSVRFTPSAVGLWSKSRPRIALRSSGQAVNRWVVW